MYFDINTSKARKTFKRLLGQTNHYLITILVGLDYINKNDVALPEEFRTSWNPRDKNASSIRSREFSINATLSWAIDALDAYLSLCHKRPTLYQQNEIQEKAGAAGQSVYKKFQVLRDLVTDDKENNFSRISALTEVAIKWRNKLVHYFAENEIKPDVKKTLTEKPEFYLKNFQGLDIEELLHRFERNQPPRFKEITSIIRAIHEFVEYSDKFLLSKINKEIHFIDCMDFHLKLNTNNDIELKKKTAILYNLSEKRRINSLNQTVMNYGFNLTKEPSTAIKEKWINNLSGFDLDKTLIFLKEQDFKVKKEMLIETK